MLKKGLGVAVDWSLVGKDDCLLAVERGPVRDTEIKLLLKGALTDAVGDCRGYMKGIDASYVYEGYAAYTMGELAEQVAPLIKASPGGPSRTFLGFEQSLLANGMQHEDERKR